MSGSNDSNGSSNDDDNDGNDDDSDSSVRMTMTATTLILQSASEQSARTALLVSRQLGLGVTANNTVNTVSFVNQTQPQDEQPNSNSRADSRADNNREHPNQ
jgi:hypothetical protein